MTPQDKAIELVNKYWRVNNSEYCALIAVDEIIDCTIPGQGFTKYSREYWQQVKQEIEKFTKP